MKVLAVETSCDETSASVVETDGDVPGARTRIVSSIVASQIDLHAIYGGVVPELASRRHVEAVVPTVAEALRAAGGAGALGGVCATAGPGLVGALLVGLNFAKGFAAARRLPFTGVNHLDGHLHAIFLEEEREGEQHPAPAYPFIALLVSGGHTHLYRADDFAKYVLLGRTVDDAAGEAFDKVAKVLGLPYPGGVSIDALSTSGDPARFPFPRGLGGKGLDFSFSGLKTAVLVKARELGPAAVESAKADLAASMQEAVADVLSQKLLAAMREHRIREAVVSGGVAANRRLRSILTERTAGTDLRVRFPRMSLCTDNAAMIAYVGAQKILRGMVDPWSLNADPAMALAIRPPT